MRVAAIFLSAFVAAALGIPIGQDVIHEQRDINGHSARVIKRSAADSNTLVPVRIALKQRNLDHGAKHLLDVSDPDSKNYAKHYTQEQVVDLFAPSQSSVHAVTDWLIKAGVPADKIGSPKSKGWLDFQTTVSHLEQILKTNYHIYEDPKTNTEHFGVEQYSLPADVSKHVDFITPAVAMAKVKRAGGGGTKGFPRVVPFRSFPPGFSIQKNDLAHCDTQVTPQCIKALYSIPDATNVTKGNQLGIFESDDELYRQSDLDIFYKKYAPKIPRGTGPIVDLIDWGKGKPNANNAEGEAALDFDVSIPVIYPQTTELYQSHDNFDGDKHLGFLNQFLDAVDGSYTTSGGGDDPNVDGTTPNEASGTFKPANVISFSYGLTENLWPVSYLERQCNEFLKLGLQGSTIVFASGDGGVAGGHGGDCLGKKQEIFNPASPSSCPWVTAVGGTVLPAGGKPGDRERAVDSFASGGGFSNIWTTPDYQKTAVSQFFKHNDPGFPYYNTSGNVIPATGGIYNRGGRGFPDIAAAGDNAVVILNGQSGTIGGTSQAAPIAAAIFTRINEERLQAGKKPIGFANPALYKKPDGFYDVIVGDQSSGGTCDNKGFSAGTGWDPVTGLGTPNYPVLVEYFKGLA